MQILIVEDNPDHLELISEILADTYGSQGELHCVSLLNDALDFLKRCAIDIMICDLSLPDSTIDETVEQLKALNDPPPIVVLTSLNDAQLAQKMVQNGIQDFLPKDELNPNQLKRACTYAIERRKLTQSILDKNDDYRAFCYSLTHDFKNSLWQISSHAEIFMREMDKPDKTKEQLPKELLQKIVGKVKKVNQMVEDLQDYLSLEVAPASMTETSLESAAHNAVDMLDGYISACRAQVDVGRLPPVYGNASQLQLLFSNLISNGIKYNRSEQPMISITAEFPGSSHFNLHIRDNGIGISASDHQKVFIPFERLHKGSEFPGTGLGLSIARRIVQAHGGKIHVESNAEGGTLFTVSLPLLERTPPQ